MAQPLNLSVYPSRNKMGAPSFATESRGRFLREIRSGAKGGIVQSACAKTTDTHLWPGRLALYYLLLLSSTSVSALQIAARPLPENSGRNQKEIPVSGRQLCGHAGTFPFAHWGTKAQEPIRGDAGTETACLVEVPGKEAPSATATYSFWTSCRQHSGNLALTISMLLPKGSIFRN